MEIFAPKAANALHITLVPRKKRQPRERSPCKGTMKINYIYTLLPASAVCRKCEGKYAEDCRYRRGFGNCRSYRRGERTVLPAERGEQAFFQILYDKVVPRPFEARAVVNVGNRDDVVVADFCEFGKVENNLVGGICRR